jgi:hypothetical protein
MSVPEKAESQLPKVQLENALLQSKRVLSQSSILTVSRCFYCISEKTHQSRSRVGRNTARPQTAGS